MIKKRLLKKVDEDNEKGFGSIRDAFKQAVKKDPNINLDVPKDSAHCVMIHTVQQQLEMSNFFDYTIKRLEYIIYKIICVQYLFHTSSTSNNYTATLEY